MNGSFSCGFSFGPGIDPGVVQREGKRADDGRGQGGRADQAARRRPEGPRPSARVSGLHGTRQTTGRIIGESCCMVIVIILVTVFGYCSTPVRLGLGNSVLPFSLVS